MYKHLVNVIIYKWCWNKTVFVVVNVQKQVWDFISSSFLMVE